MGVWAHPDDETFMIGGIMSMAAANGQKVVSVTATKGEAGLQDESKWPAAQLGSIREKELEAALNILGTPHHSWLDCQDGLCTNADEQEVVTKLVQTIEEHKPDTIITFPPDGLTGHPDHKAVSAWAQAAVAASNYAPTLYFAVQTQESYDSFWRVVDENLNVYFATDNPQFVPQAECDICILLEPAVAAKKTTALKIMPSQYQSLFEFLGDKGVEAAAGVEALVRSK